LIAVGRAFAAGPLSKFTPMLQEELKPDEEFATPPNEFSGPGYRVINFVADLPVRLDSFVCRAGDPLYGDYGQVVFVLTEFQVVDQATAVTNEQGENSHLRYKERQHARVRARLTR